MDMKKGHSQNDGHEMWIVRWKISNAQSMTSKDWGGNWKRLYLDLLAAHEEAREGIVLLRSSWWLGWSSVPEEVRQGAGLALLVRSGWHRTVVAFRANLLGVVGLGAAESALRTHGTHGLFVGGALVGIGTQETRLQARRAIGA